jgi:hypothetical protein
MLDTVHQHLREEISRLKIRVETLETYLSTVSSLPILDPAHLAEYRETIRKALEAADL